MKTWWLRGHTVDHKQIHKALNSPDDIYQAKPPGRLPPIVQPPHDESSDSNHG